MINVNFKSNHTKMKQNATNWTFPFCSSWFRFLFFCCRHLKYDAYSYYVNLKVYKQNFN